MQRGPEGDSSAPRPPLRQEIAQQLMIPGSGQSPKDRDARHVRQKKGANLLMTCRSWPSLSKTRTPCAIRTTSCRGCAAVKRCNLHPAAFCMLLSMESSCLLHPELLLRFDIQNHAQDPCFTCITVGLELTPQRAPCRGLVLGGGGGGGVHPFSITLTLACFTEHQRCSRLSVCGPRFPRALVKS